MTFEDLPCKDFVELATGYLEGHGLTTSERVVAELHLVVCAPCVDYLDQLRGTVRITAELRDQDVPTSVMEPLIEAFRRVTDTAG